MVVAGYALGMPKPKRKASKQINKHPLARKHGDSGLESFISHMKVLNEDVGNMVLLEPREWLDYACVGVTEDNGVKKISYRAIYDLNLLEHAYALMYAYEEFGYESIDKLITHATPEQFDMAQEWVSYNTLRGSQYMGLDAPLFIRTHSPNDWQSAAKWTQEW